MYSSESLVSFDAHTLHTNIELKRLVLGMLENGSLTMASSFIVENFRTYEEAEEFINAFLHPKLSQDIEDLLVDTVQSIYDIDSSGD